MYRIWCIVSGGVTGHREAWMKKDGSIYETESYREALEWAVELNKKMNDCFSTAFFRYTVKQV